MKLRSKLALTIKEFGAEAEKNKARLVAMGHLDAMKDYIINEAPTLMRHAFRLILAIASIMDLTVYSRDVKQAYLQAGAPLQRPIYMHPPKGYEKVSEGSMLKLKKPLHGVTEAGSYWHNTYERFYKKDMKMESFLLDPCFFYKKEGNQLTGMVGILVDDSVAAGAKELIEMEDNMVKRFKMNPKQLRKFTFSGMRVDQVNERKTTLDQEDYIGRLNKIKSLNPDPECFAKARGQIAWRALSTRPDLAFLSAKLSQRKPNEINRDDMKLLKKAVKLLQDINVTLKHHKLDMETVSIAACADASFASNWDLSSQLGYIVLLTDATKKCSILHWSSSKSHRVTRSALGSEVYAFCEGMDIGLAFQFALEAIIGRRIDVNMFTDSKSLLDTITRLSQASEKRLLIDIAAVREAHRKKEISNVGWVKSKNNLADGLTKYSKSNILNDVIENSMLDHPIEQWIVR